MISITDKGPKSCLSPGIYMLIHTETHTHCCLMELLASEGDWEGIFRDWGEKKAAFVLLKSPLGDSENFSSKVRHMVKWVKTNKNKQNRLLIV